MRCRSTSTRPGFCSMARSSAPCACDGGGGFWAAPGPATPSSPARTNGSREKGAVRGGAPHGDRDANNVIRPAFPQGRGNREPNLGANSRYVKALNAGGALEQPRHRDQAPIHRIGGQPEALKRERAEDGGSGRPETVTDPLRPPLKPPHDLCRNLADPSRLRRS